MVPGTETTETTEEGDIDGMAGSATLTSLSSSFSFIDETRGWRMMRRNRTLGVSSRKRNRFRKLTVTTLRGGGGGAGLRARIPPLILLDGDSSTVIVVTLLPGGESMNPPDDRALLTHFSLVDQIYLSLLKPSGIVGLRCVFLSIVPNPFLGGRRGNSASTLIPFFTVFLLSFFTVCCVSLCRSFSFFFRCLIFLIVDTLCFLSSTLHPLQREKEYSCFLR